MWILEDGAVSPEVGVGGGFRSSRVTAQCSNTDSRCPPACDIAHSPQRDTPGKLQLPTSLDSTQCRSAVRECRRSSGITHVVTRHRAALVRRCRSTHRERMCAGSPRWAVESIASTLS